MFQEGHTMVERDLGSTFLMPESHLFKPDRDRVGVYKNRLRMYKDKLLHCN